MTTDVAERKTALIKAPDSPGQMDWDVHSIVSELRALRDASLAARQRLGSPVKLPSRTALAGIIDNLSAALFPNRLGARVLADESVDYFVGHAIDVSLRELVDQLDRELRFGSRQSTIGDGPAERAAQRQLAVAIVRNFAAALPEIRAIGSASVASVLARSGLLVLCGCGGSNGYRRHRFNEELSWLASDLRREIRVAHYPPGCSKYNPIEHRLFCHATRAIQGVPLKTIQVAQQFIARTATSTGLKVIAEIADTIYERGQKATREFLADLPSYIDFEPTLPKRNYTALAF